MSETACQNTKNFAPINHLLQMDNTLTQVHLEMAARLVYVCVHRVIWFSESCIIAGHWRVTSVRMSCVMGYSCLLYTSELPTIYSV